MCSGSLPPVQTGSNAGMQTPGLFCRAAHRHLQALDDDEFHSPSASLGPDSWRAVAAVVTSLVARTHLADPRPVAAPSSPASGLSTRGPNVHPIWMLQMPLCTRHLSETLCLEITCEAP